MSSLCHHELIKLQASLLYVWAQGPVSLSNKTSYSKISLSLEAARFVFRIVRSLWNLTGALAAVLLMCVSNFKVMQWFKLLISLLRTFTRSYNKTSHRILKRGSECCQQCVCRCPGPGRWHHWNWLMRCHSYRNFHANAQIYFFQPTPVT